MMDGVARSVGRTRGPCLGRVWWSDRFVEIVSDANDDRRDTWYLGI